MDCTKFKDWLKDAALEGLAPRQEAELRSHLDACANCRAEFEQHRMFLNAVDQAIAHVTEGEPSPGFAARVRQRVAEHPAPVRGWLPSWAPITAVAALAVVLLVVWLLPQEPVAPGPPIAPPLAPPIARNNADKGSEPPAPPVVLKAVSRPNGKRTPSIAIVSIAPSSLEVRISPDEQEGLSQFIMASLPGRAQAAGFPEIRAATTVKPVESEQLAISPIALKDLEVAPISAVGTDSQTR